MLCIRTALPSVAQEGIRVDIALDVVDPLPPAKERLLGETGELGGALRGDIPRFDEEL